MRYRQQPLRRRGQRRCGCHSPCSAQFVGEQGWHSNMLDSACGSAIIGVNCQQSYPQFPTFRITPFARMTHILLLIVGLTGGTGADHWDRFRGPNGTGTVDDKDVPLTFSATDNVIWKT